MAIPDGSVVGDLQARLVVGGEDPAGFCVCNALEHGFPVMYVSERLQALTGYSPDDMVGRSMNML